MPISEKVCLRIGLELLKILEKIHYVGYVCNDLRPTNVRVCLHEGQVAKVYLLSLCLATPYKASSGIHLADAGATGSSDSNGSTGKTKHLKKWAAKTSRRDDILHLCSLLLYYSQNSNPKPRSRHIPTKQKPKSTLALPAQKDYSAFIHPIMTKVLNLSFS